MTDFACIKYQLRPTDQQQSSLFKFCWSTRYTYNAMLAKLKAEKESGEKLLTGYARLSKVAKSIRETDEKSNSLLETPAYPSTAAAAKHLSKAFDVWRKNWCEYKKRPTGKPPRFPSFRRRGQNESFEFQYPQLAIRADGKVRAVRIIKLGWVAIHADRPPAGRTIAGIVKHECGRWYIIVRFEKGEPAEVHGAHGSQVGVDMGVSHNLALSDGTLLNQPDVSDLEKKILAAQRVLSRRQAVRLKCVTCGKVQESQRKFECVACGSAANPRRLRPSKRWVKAKGRLARLHEKRARVLGDFRHKSTTDLAKRFELIALEDLRVRNMTRSAKGTEESPGRNVRAKSGLNKSILRQSWFETRRQLEYKSRWLGGHVLAVNPAYTSRTCPECGHESPDNRPTRAQFECVECGHMAHADTNAARNILARAKEATP